MRLVRVLNFAHRQTRNTIIFSPPFYLLTFIRISLACYEKQPTVLVLFANSNKCIITLCYGRYRQELKFL